MNLDSTATVQSVEQASDAQQAKDVLESTLRFIEWLNRYGETSYDFQSYYSSDLGRKAKALYYKAPMLGTLAVSPMIFSEAFLPAAKRLFWKRQRFPIGDAHYAMAFAFLAGALKTERYYTRAVHFLEVLKSTRCEGYRHWCWGYPFNWETINGTIEQGTPLITTVPYVYEAFKQVWEIDRSDEWLKIMNSIACHALEDYKDIETSPSASTCSYTPDPKKSVGVVNANAYRSFLLMSAAVDFSDDKFWRAGLRNLNFVVEAQNPDGSWYYARDGRRSFIDHFHTCFVLKALAKIEEVTGYRGCRETIDRGLRYYVANLFDTSGAPKPFSVRPRLTVYRRELYDYAECINLAVLLKGRFPELDRLSSVVLDEITNVWQKRDGSFRSRRLLFGWDSVPMHRWAQAQLFRSLCFLLYRAKAGQPAGAHKGSASNFVRAS